MKASHQAAQLPLIQLARIRKNLGLTQSAIGARVGLSGQYIGMLEAGFRPTSEQQVVSIAGALGVPIDVLQAATIRIDCSSISGNVTVTRG